MTEKRTEALLYQALGYISQMKSGFSLYDCLHNCVGMTNAEIEEAGYELGEFYQKDMPEQLAAASDKRYILLEELERQARRVVDFIIQEGNDSNGNQLLRFDEMEKQSGLCVKGRAFFQQLIGNMLCERLEVADLSIDENGFDVIYHPEFRSNCQLEQAPKTLGVPGSEESFQTLRDLLRIPWADIHLVHKDVEIDPATIVELSPNTLTDAGKHAWSDVLDANVCRVYEGVYGLSVEVAGVKPTRLQSFSAMLAGYCSEENYEKWVGDPEESTEQSPEMKL